MAESDGAEHVRKFQKVFDKNSKIVNKNKILNESFEKSHIEILHLNNKITYLEKR